MTVAATALLTSLLTGAGVYFYVRFRLLDQIEKELDEYSIILKAKLKEGVSEAGKELLPEFREEVRAGFREAITDALSGSLVDETVRQTLTRTTSIIESGLGMFLGKRPGDNQPPGGSK